MTRCFFTPPSMRNHRSQFSVISMGFPPDSRRLSVHFYRFSVVFNQFQSVLINFNKFESILISFNQFDSVKNTEFIDDRKVGETTRNHEYCTGSQPRQLTPPVSSLATPPPSSSKQSGTQRKCVILKESDLFQFLDGGQRAESTQKYSPDIKSIHKIPKHLCLILLLFLCCCCCCCCCCCWWCCCCCCCCCCNRQIVGRPRKTES